MILDFRVQKLVKKILRSITNIKFKILNSTTQNQKSLKNYRSSKFKLL